MAEMPEILVAPLFVEANGYTSTIAMVNELTFAVSADVLLFDQTGAKIASQTVNFPPHSQQALAVGDLLRQANSAATMGSVELHADPAKVYTMAIAAQLSITGSGINAGQHIEEEFVMLGMQGSGVLHSAGTALAGQPVVALRNGGASAQTATVACLAEKGGLTQRQVPLAAGGSAFVQACSNSVNPAFSVVGNGLAAPTAAQANLGAFGLSVAGTGTPGTLTAFAFAWRTTPRGPMLSSQNFLDAGLAQSANVVFTGVPIGAATALPAAAFTPEVAVANFGPQAANASVVFARTDDSGPAATTVATAVVPAMSAKTIPLPALTGDPGLRNSFIVQSDALPGTFYASIVSVGSSGFDLVEQIGKDQLSGENAGNHPWALTDPSQDALLLLFNHNSTPTYFNVRIGSGGVLWQQAWQLVPMETRAVSLRELIADQVKDENGATLPQTLTQGEISWFTPDPGEGKGRLVQIDRAPQLVAGNLRVARNFSCGNYVVLCGASLTTTLINIPAGTDSSPSYLGALIAALCLSNLYSDCQGQSHGTGGSGYSYLWTSNNTSIATVDAPGTSSTATFFGVSPGQGSATGQISTHYCTGSGSGTPITTKLVCDPSPVTRGSQVTCAVQPSGATASNWLFTSSTLPGVTVSPVAGKGNYTPTQWFGTAVDTGTVRALATFGGKSVTVTAQINVVARTSGFTAPMPAQPLSDTPNGTSQLITLKSPPTPNDEQDGDQWAFGYYGYNASFTPGLYLVGDNGPNGGYYYLNSFMDSSTFIYEYNPGLTDTTDPFYMAQYGNCGIASVADIKTAVRNHEYAGTPSHYSEIKVALAAMNPGTVAEAIVEPANFSGFRDYVFQQVNPVYNLAITAGKVEPTTNLPSGVNYPPYKSCP